MYFSKFEKPHNFSLPRTFFCGHCTVPGGDGIVLLCVEDVLGAGHVLVAIHLAVVARDSPKGPG
jgi:hypothetical protein